ncbi:hypothetical protein [Saccharospirillum impatiens]|uniref:hypothetical protein n=1 Tax=Saccharospirillum impatiens TaxID=169438 RepID=UPI000407C49B|nr:hypothetical protein [Saccharospirillum impatiens]
MNFSALIVSYFACPGRRSQRGIPVATVIGGGYDDDRQALARRHATIVEVAAELRR